VSNLREIVREIKSRIDCRALAEELGLPRRYDRFRCPFHDDRNPDLSVQPNGYRCFACGAKGDAIAMYRGVRNVGFREALEFLAARCGLTVPATPGGRARRSVRPQIVPQVAAPRPARQDEPPTISPERRIEIYTTFADAGRLQLDHAPHAPAFVYLKRRGISGATAIDAGLGFVADYGLAAHWLRERTTVAELQAAKHKTRTVVITKQPPKPPEPPSGDGTPSGAATCDSGGSGKSENATAQTAQGDAEGRAVRAVASDENIEPPDAQPAEGPDLTEPPGGSGSSGGSAAEENDNAQEREEGDA
jgi:hypothetical protein